MIWIICAIISTFLFVLGIALLLFNRKEKLRVIYVLGALFTSSYVAYLPIFLEKYDTISSLFAGAFNLLQLMTINADFLKYYELIIGCISSNVLEITYVVLLAVLHFVVPIVSAISAISLFIRWLSTIKLHFIAGNNKPIFIFTETNERAMALARDFKQLKYGVVFCDCDEKTIAKGKNSGFVFKAEKAEEINIKIKKDKDVYFICLCENEDKSLSATLSLIEKYSKFDSEQQESVHIYQFSKYKDYSLYIDSTDKGCLDIRCINEYEALIYNLLDKYPLYKWADKKIHVLLYGLSDVNLMALKNISWCGKLYGYELKISAIGKNLDSKIDDFKFKYPGLFEKHDDVNLYSVKTESEAEKVISEKLSDANYIIVSEETDNATMEKAVELRRLFYKVDNTYSNCPPIFCYVQDEFKFNAIKNLKTAEKKEEKKMSYNLIPFGNLQEIYSVEYLVDSPLEKIARNVHFAYAEIFSDGKIDKAETLKDYSTFEVNKRSNRANALHIRYKLNLLGLDYTDDKNAESVDLNEYLTEDLLKKLAISEHDRWLTFLHSEGWTTSTKQDVYAYRESGISKGRHNCPLLKMHPYICEYEKLTDLSMEIEGKDTTLYDVELIKRIPEILGDKWGVAKKKFKIIKRR